VANRWGLAFTVAALLALGGGAYLRRAAQRPITSSRSLRRSGGVVLAAALVGWVFAPDHPSELVALAIAAAALAIAGTLADRGDLRGRAVALVILVASVVPVIGGVRAELSGVPEVDVVLTVLGIAALTAAVAGLGNTDGLMAFVGAGAAAGVFGLAAFGDQDSLATVAVALGGACVGFLAYNLRPASLFVGQAGALPVGIILAVAAIEIRPSIGAPESFAVPLILLGLPITDAAVVALTRFRHRKPLLIRRPDHFPHRLRAREWRTGRVVSVLTAVQLVLSAIAVVVGRGLVAPEIGGAVAALVLIGLTFVAAHGRVYKERARGPSGVAIAVLLGVGVVAMVASVATVLAGIQARDLLTDGRSAANRAVNAARRGQPDVAAQRFAQAARDFGEANDKLGSPLLTPGLVVPVLGSNLHAARELSSAGLDLARAGEQLTAPVDPEKLRLRGGRIDLAEVERITPSLEEAAVLLSRTAERVDDLNTAFLIEPVRDAIDEVEEELSDTEQDAVRGAAAAKIAPAVLGAEGPRRYFLAVQNPAELRATGGFIGSWGILTAVDGKVDLEFMDRVDTLNQGTGPDAAITGPEEYLRRYGQFEPAQTWQNVNMSPDFAVVGEVISELYPLSGGEEIDGVLAVDPAGLAALMRLTGPVTVDGWPEPITADNVVDVTLRQAYEVFARSPERAEFLGDVADVVFDVATEGDLGQPGRVANVLGKATREGHFSLYFTRPAEEEIAVLVNADGTVPRTNRDSLMVVTQNAGANKIDYYLRRHVDYSVELDPIGSGKAHVSGTLDVGLENTAPNALLPQAVIGPSEGLEERFSAGENYAYVSAYTPTGLTAVSVNGMPTEVEAGEELGRNVFSTFLSTMSGATTTMSLGLDGEVSLGPDRWYTLELVRQPSLNADDVSIELEVPKGWKIAETRNLGTDGDRRAQGTVELAETTTVGVRLEPSGVANVWDQLHQGS
jgi:UDP-N-acetylmuramyl pentapeptide phosphotransferase/UDP-N-acetylglucosamine-1-phosphate transferase